MDAKSFHVESTATKLKWLKKPSYRTGELEWQYTVSAAHAKSRY